MEPAIHGDRVRGLVMPLVPGKGRKTVSNNIRELLHKYKSSGKIGTSAPKNMAAARRQAAAIAYRKKREG